jgi:hypothetical protein
MFISRFVVASMDGRASGVVLTTPLLYVRTYPKICRVDTEVLQFGTTSKKQTSRYRKDSCVMNEVSQYEWEHLTSVECH